MVKGWFRTSRQPTHGGTHLRCVALTAYEVASALAYIHSQGIMHLVRSETAGPCLMQHKLAPPFKCMRLGAWGCGVVML